MLFEREQFYKTNKQLIVKSLEELCFEEVLVAQKVTEESDRYILELDFEARYEFQASYGAWGNLQVHEKSLRKFICADEVFEYTVSSFFCEAQRICGLSDDTLAQYLEEAHQTIYGLIQKHNRLNELNFKELIDQNFAFLDQVLLGHPKLIMSHGRIGLTLDDLKKFSPEVSPSFQLRWVAAHREVLEFEQVTRECLQTLSLDALGQAELEDIQRNLPGELFEDFQLIPVHPWQWKKYIAVQFAEYFCQGKLVDLGERGEKYTPQSSLRTLSQVKTSRFDIKLPLSILNTSCVRGIPSKYIQTSSTVSHTVDQIIKDDPLLNVQVLNELFACKVHHPQFDKLKESSYRFQELFGHIWRESVDSKLQAGEQAIPTAALLVQNENDFFISSLVERSGFSPQKWVHSYFQCVVTPLYHLQVAHGIGLVAHGQNTILVHRSGRPVRLIIKDFHGDLRLSNDSPYKDRKEFASLDRLRPEHLIHDLFTGHLVSVLRYLSRLFSESNLLDETSFYRLLSGVIQDYHKTSGHEPEENNLLKSNYERVLVNKVRYSVGYSELARPLPMLGTPLSNPLSSHEVQL